MNVNAARQFLASPRLADDLRTAVQIGIDDIGAGRFCSFDAPAALAQHLQELAATILSHGKTAPLVRDASGTQNQTKIF